MAPEFTSGRTSDGDLPLSVLYHSLYPSQGPGMIVFLISLIRRNTPCHGILTFAEVI